MPPSVFGRFLAPNSIVGCGIEMAPEAEWSGVKAKYELPDEYVLYLGRVSKAKVDKLLPYFLRCKAKYGGDAKLVLVGGFENRDPKVRLAGHSFHGLCLRRGKNRNRPARHGDGQPVAVWRASRC